MCGWIESKHPSVFSEGKCVNFLLNLKSQHSHLEYTAGSCHLDMSLVLRTSLTIQKSLNRPSIVCIQGQKVIKNRNLNIGVLFLGRGPYF